MNLRILAILLAAAYVAFSILFIVMGGFQEPRRAIWVGLIGVVVIATAMALFRTGRRK